jgi:hypothetical protein
VSGEESKGFGPGHGAQVEDLLGLNHAIAGGIHTEDPLGIAPLEARPAVGSVQGPVAPRFDAFEGGQQSVRRHVQVESVQLHGWPLDGRAPRLGREAVRYEEEYRYEERVEYPARHGGASVSSGPLPATTEATRSGRSETLDEFLGLLNPETSDFSDRFDASNLVAPVRDKLDAIGSHDPLCANSGTLARVQCQATRTPLHVSHFFACSRRPSSDPPCFSDRTPCQHRESLPPRRCGRPALDRDALPVCAHDLGLSDQATI